MQTGTSSFHIRCKASRWWKTLTLAFSLALFASHQSVGQTADLEYGFPAPRVLLIGIDGLTLESISPTTTPHLNVMLESGKLVTFRANSGPITDPDLTASTQTWARLLTDVGITISDNEPAGRSAPAARHLFDRIRRVKPETSISLLTPSIDLLHWVNNRADSKQHTPVDSENPYFSLLELVSGANQVLKSTNPDLAFVHVPLPATNNAAISTAQYDRLVGMLLDTVVKRPAYADEDWLILVVNPGIPESATDTSAFMLAAGKSVPHERAVVSAALADLAPTILRHMELLALEAGIFSGQPIPIFSNDNELRERRILMPIMNAIRNLQAESEATARKFESMQREAEARLRVHDEELLNKTAAAFNSSVERLRESAALGTARSLDAIADSQKTIVTIVLALFTAGLFGAIFLMWIQFRSVKNMASVVRMLNSNGHTELGKHRPHDQLGPTPQGAYLLDAIQRLESRIDTLQTPPAEELSSGDSFVETKQLGKRRTHRRFGGN